MKNTLSIIGLLLISICVACKTDTKSAPAEATTEKVISVSKESAVNKTQGKFKVQEVADATKPTEKVDQKELENKVKESVKQAKTKTVATADKVKEVVDTKVMSTIPARTKEPVTKIISETVTKATPVAQSETPATTPVSPAKKEIVAKPEPAPIEKKVEKAPAAKFVPMHEVFDGLLKRHVSKSGKVDYAGFKGDITLLDGYLKTLSTTSLTGKSKKEKLAFWINAYNAFTIKKIVNNYPLNSITDLDGGKPWDTKWIKLDGQNLSLNNIENDIIRPQFKEPRIHFAVNCAAKSCPPLLNKAWTANNLESNFEKQTKAFVNSALNTLTPDKLILSKIFEWYGEDFGDLETFIKKYAQTTINAGAEISFQEYDWSLNN